MNKFNKNKGQAMILTVVLLSGAVLASTSLVALIVLYQLRQATDVSGSTQAIFAADSGLEWAYYNETRDPGSRLPYPHTLILSNGASVTVTKDPSDPLPLKSVGQKGRSARAFQANSPAAGSPSLFDVMLVIDRSGSISNAELLLATNAGIAFVDTINPSADGSHMGLVSFSTDVTLDQHLSDDGDSIKAALAAMKTKGRGTTNLAGGIDAGSDEMRDSHIHERSEVKDIMILITDGEPNAKNPGDSREARIAAREEADDARSEGVEVFVVGVGVNSFTEAFLRDRIADDPAHYYPVADFTGLQAILQAIAQAILSGKEVAP